MLFGGRDGLVRFWNLTTNTATGPSLPHQGAIRSLALTTDGQQLVTFDGTMSLWERARGTRRTAPLQHQGNVICASFRPDGQELLTGSSDGKVRVWSVPDGVARGELTEHQAKIATVAYSLDGKRAVTASSESFVCVWNTATWKLQHKIHLDQRLNATLTIFHAPTSRVFTVEDVRNVCWRTLDEVVPTTVAHMAPVTRLAVRPDGGAVLSADQNKVAKLWNTHDARMIAEFVHPHPLDHVGFTPDGRWALTKDRQHQVRIWDGQTGQPIGEWSLPEAATQVSVGPDSTLLLAFGHTPTTRLRLLPEGRSVGRELRHQEEIYSAAFAPDQRSVTTVSADRTARRWHVPTGFPIGPPLAFNDKLLSVVFREQGDICVVTGWNGNVALWDTPSPLVGERRALQNSIEQQCGIILEADGSTSVMTASDWHKHAR